MAILASAMTSVAEHVQCALDGLDHPLPRSVIPKVHNLDLPVLPLFTPTMTLPVQCPLECCTGVIVAGMLPWKQLCCHHGPQSTCTVGYSCTSQACSYTCCNEQFFHLKAQALTEYAYRVVFPAVQEFVVFYVGTHPEQRQTVIDALEDQYASAHWCDDPSALDIYRSALRLPVEWTSVALCAANKYIHEKMVAPTAALASPYEDIGSERLYNATRSLIQDIKSLEDARSTSVASLVRETYDSLDPADRTVFHAKLHVLRPYLDDRGCGRVLTDDAVEILQKFANEDPLENMSEKQKILAEIHFLCSGALLKLIQAAAISMSGSLMLAVNVAKHMILQDGVPVANALYKASCVLSFPQYCALWENLESMQVDGVEEYQTPIPSLVPVTTHFDRGSPALGEAVNLAMTAITNGRNPLEYLHQLYQNLEPRDRNIFMNTFPDLAIAACPLEHYPGQVVQPTATPVAPSSFSHSNARRPGYKRSWRSDARAKKKPRLRD